MHWFKWQAYTTWLSGAALLIAVYYVGGRTLMIDAARAALSPSTAIAVGAGAIAGGFVLYELLWRVVGPRSLGVALALSLVALVAAVAALTRFLSGRAAFLHVGAMLGTIMAGNVALTIMPSQRVLEAAVREGKGADPAVTAAAKTRSIHNNYITFPVIALMLSSHLPALYANRLSWLVLLILVAGGAAVRHVMNVRFAYPVARWAPALAAVVLAALVPLYLLVARSGARAAAPSAADGTPAHVTFADARTVIDRRCAACHSREPSDVSLGVTPAGVAFDTPEQIRALAPRILERAVVTRTMPPANKTRMTERERAILGRWIEQGAPP
jgi:uncharacterized membrane protein